MAFYRFEEEEDERFFCSIFIAANLYLGMAEV